MDVSSPSSRCHAATFTQLAFTLDDPDWHEHLPYDHVAFYLYGVRYEYAYGVASKLIAEYHFDEGKENI